MTATGKAIRTKNKGLFESEKILKIPTAIKTKPASKMHKVSNLVLFPFILSPYLFCIVSSMVKTKMSRFLRFSFYFQNGPVEFSSLQNPIQC